MTGGSKKGIRRVLAGLLFVEAEPFPAGPNWMERLYQTLAERNEILRENPELIETPEFGKLDNLFLDVSEIGDWHRISPDPQLPEVVLRNEEVLDKMK